MMVSLESRWLYIISSALVVVWGISLLIMRLWTRHHVIKALMREAETAAGVCSGSPDPRPEYRAAQEIICNYRRRYLLKWWPGTVISFKAINEMSLDLIREIARVFYPEEDRPELKASLADLVALHTRVGTRLAAWLETVPMRPFKDVELGTLVRYHEMYQSVKSHWGYAFIKRHRLDKIARWGWTAFNYANPWHWGRKVAYHGGKEVAARLLMARIADLVGEEAMRIYGQEKGRVPVEKKGRGMAVSDRVAAAPAPHQ
jgi:hypothetical protein